jgi:serine/threonine-protein kinase
VSGTPLLQMSLFDADGSPLAPRGPLRVVTVASQKRSPLQLLVINEGVAPTRISLSLRADPPAPAAVPEPPSPGEAPPPPEGATPAPAPAEGPGEAAAPATPEAPSAPAESEAIPEIAPDGGPPPR